MLSAGGFFAYRRVTSVRARAKQIVAASAWKTFASVTTIPKPSASSSLLAPDAKKDPNLTQSRDIVKAPDVSALVSLSKSAEVSIPLTSGTPSVASKLSLASSVTSRRQELANRAAALAEIDIDLAEPDVDLSQPRPNVAHDKSRFLNTSPERQNSVPSGNLQNSILSVLQRRQQHQNLISEAWKRASPPQVSPTRLPSTRLSSPSPLSRSQAGHISPRVASLLTNRSRSASRSLGSAAAGSPFFMQQGQQTNQATPRSNPSPVSRSRTPLPSSRARSVGRATSSLESGQLWTATTSASPDRLGTSSFDRHNSPRDQSLSPNYRANVSRLSPTSAVSFSPLSTSSPRSTSRPGLSLPLRSSQNGAGSGSRTRYDQA